MDFRARTAASYGHAFVWYGRTADKEVEVAGLHPRGDMVPYLLGHLIFVPAETGASYGDLDEQYLTARYRVYLSEADAEKVFSYIKHLQATSPVWNVETIDCVYFIGRIASFMGLKTPSHFLKKPEAYVNELRALNSGRQTVAARFQPGILSRRSQADASGQFMPSLSYWFFRRAFRWLGSWSLVIALASSP